jgi:hypothetical protein
MLLPAADRDTSGDGVGGPGLGLRARIGLPWGGAQPEREREEAKPAPEVA